MKILFKNSGGGKSLCFSKLQLLFLNLNKLPVIRKTGFVKRMICKIYNVPLSTGFGKDFCCLHPILHLGENVSLADTLIVGWGKTFESECSVTIGNNCSFSYKNVIITSTHDFNNFNRVIGEKVTIGNNVWITTNVTVLPGVNIGDNTVIGAGSVVTKDIPAGVFAAGNPCKVIRKIDFKK